MMNLSDIPGIDRLMVEEPKAAFEAILKTLSERLRYAMSLQQIEAVRTAMQVAFSLGERFGAQTLINQLKQKESE